jgi:hypothetical protein
MPLNLPLVSGVIFCVGISCIVIANLIFYIILGEVNDGRGPNDQIGMLFVNVRSFEVTRLHKELFPDSNKPTAMYVIGLLGFALCIGAIVPNIRIGPTR